MTQNTQQIIPAHQVALNVFRGKVIKEGDKSFIQRLVCAKHKGNFYIHKNAFKTEVGTEGFSFFLPKADIQAENLLTNIKKHGSINLSSGMWVAANEDSFRSTLEDYLHDEYNLKDKYKLEFGTKFN